MTGKEFASRIDFILGKRNQSRKAITTDLGISSASCNSKKIQKTPQRELDTALARMKEYTTEEDV